MALTDLQSISEDVGAHFSYFEDAFSTDLFAAQIASVASAMSRIQDRLVACASQAETECDSLKDSVADLTKKGAELDRRVRWLTHQKLELERRFAQQKPDLDNAIRARDAALKRLQNAYKVIRDLVRENERLQVAGAPSSPSQTKDEEREGMKTALEEAMAGISISSSDSGSGRTAPKHRAPLLASAKDPIHTERRRRPSIASEADEGSVDGQESPPTTSSAESSSSESVRPSQEIGEWADTTSYSIYYGHPPGSSDMSLGPVELSRLLQHDMITQATIDSLKSLELASDTQVRVHTFKRFVFLFDPIFLEARIEEDERDKDEKKSFILDWGTPDVHQSLETYIRDNKYPLHTFLFPTEKSKRKVMTKLLERSQGKEDEDAITAALDDGVLRQLCLEISSDGQLQKSMMLARRMGYQAPQAMA
ncbi:hypothetical protein DXG03_000241 [Asterophora parasitica]|uniref:Uncharacterized protein n=1 Tax=Asterophora parasitica TaxID=117018 RepID=A0A9P7GKY4_9AGAR|nr:hypothetical protein DXG03_000241 [Asterophora parasitica]